MKEFFVDHLIDIHEGRIEEIRKYLVFFRTYVFDPVVAQYMLKLTKHTSFVVRDGVNRRFFLLSYALYLIDQF